MEIEKLNVFGRPIVIYPESLIVNVVKYNEKIVYLRIENQFTAIIETPILVEEYGVTADEFIAEFQKQNMEVYMKKIRNNINE